MGYEVEIKFHALDPAALERKLKSMGAAAHVEIEQLDIYLSHPSRDFRATGEAFRIRHDEGGNRLTYKGPKHNGPTKTREEIEIAFEEGTLARQKMIAMFDRLGFLPVATIGKTRRSYQLERDGRAIEISIDKASGLGTFAEVEAIAHELHELPDAQATVIALADELELTVVEPRSYLRMHLEQAEAEAANPTIQK
jgi:adenylate cyclase class 2